jgi:4a-hydroxytetrahydrobiopterin dehydratase
MNDLLEKKCIPCEGGTLPLTQSDITELLSQVSGWVVSLDLNKLSKEYTFENFATAMAFANQIAQIAEEEGHHPDLLVSWGKVGVSLSTHSISGLSENDFILAAKIDMLQNK